MKFGFKNQVQWEDIDHDRIVHSNFDSLGFKKPSIRQRSQPQLTSSLNCRPI